MAIGELHSKDIMHRDLKLENILVDSKGYLKIIDYGFMSPLEGKKGQGFNETRCGTPNYMAPEVHRREKYNGQVQDLFSLGVILFVMYAGRPPFQTATSDDMLFKLLQSYQFSAYWKYQGQDKPEGFYSPAFRNLIELMLHHKPGYRGTLADVVGHPWLQEPE